PLPKVSKTFPISLGSPGASQTPPLFQTRSYVGALRGPESTPVGGNQNWIPVGSHDITSSVSNGVKSLSLSKEFKEKLCKPWSSSVVVRLLGRNIGYSFLCHRLHAIWKPVGQLHIVDLDKNCFMVKFANDQDYFKALTGGPWMILDHYLIVHQWDPSFRVVNDLPKKMVAWVRFPHLPIHFYHVQVLTSLGNLVGEPASDSPVPTSEPASDRYGPWMVVARRSSRPKKESQAGKVRADPRTVSAVIPE
ncbi:hypothetical protein LINPERHAP2_LOCUS18778, partial [Linum perenne]